MLPPFPYVQAVATLAHGRRLQVGAQHLALTQAGAWTGEVSAEMLADVGASSVLIGHSERREHFGLTDPHAAVLYARALEAGLKPILCVGESLAERDAGRTLEVVTAQVAAVLAAVGVAGIARGAVAYEPRWAIGTGRNASGAEAQAVHSAIRSQIAVIDGTVAGSLQILYGGSVKPSNAADLMREPDIDGALVGGASLDPQAFAAIVAAAPQIAVS